MLAPGAIGIAKQFGVTSTQGTYVASASSVVPAISPFFWIPLSRRYGRRPILMVGSVVAIVFGIVVGRAETYGQALGCRILMAFGASSAICIGPAAISDMFFLHEKGTRMGINTFLLVCSPYLGGVAGGSLQYQPRLGWRWAMYISSVIYVVVLILQFLLVPETIFDRSQAQSTPEKPKTMPSSRFGFRKPTTQESWSYLFTRPFAMFAYPAVLLPSLWFAIAAMTEVANTAGFPLNFGADSRWHFNTQQIGFCSFSGLIGAVLGEIFAGPLCDLVVQHDLKKGRRWKPERLLPLTLPGLVTSSAGVLLYGLELNYPTHWAAALAGIAIFTAGQEIMLTVLMTYITECYPGNAAEISVCFQCCLNLMAYHPPFYTPYWIKAPGGAKVPYIVYAVLPILFAPIGCGMFMWKGEEIRAKGPWFRF
ncbi:major facilitator superfamily domain-containing protein [Pseudomassariella vexata]|uniref:Major facilitator superfamily domain-containing protein n=1 Tax=Pseudomassariella vexata TaxID=1141098 RepID=A0A1Y2DC69_9PEZI|nr:major facilitator superfamily domain-containing protein [Pseudomassariella vexata]ORY56861.1 major facilitator superfamily domain-containing protein [Pseudomassariella vexata]